MTRCLSCRANVTSLSIISVIEQHMRQYTVTRAWEMSTYGATLRYLKQHVHAVVTSEYYPDHSPGAMVGHVLNQDVQQLTFDDASLDLITSNQVFEHVPDDVQGYGECYRVLRSNGALIFTVPLADDPTTFRLAEIVNGRIMFHAAPEYHDSRITGPHSVLAFWRHSRIDICNRVAQVGFRTQLVDVILSSSQRVPAKVIYAIKP
ncbi:hypothetical protein YTPLAS18_25130 [Nitrospira sp.]|nr:hypothetical protein YTPLAS18_25130 [Nitrospira sp.]